MQLENGWLTGVKQVFSPHFDLRPENETPSLLVIHNISLPPNKFDGDYIDQLFTGVLDPDEHPYFAEIAHLRVSAHCLIRRDGEIIQYVSFDKRAWHAGISQFSGREKCNDFSIGIELEGTDRLPFTQSQYKSLTKISALLFVHYPITSERIVGHSDISSGRKTDPGSEFNWQLFQRNLANLLI